MLPVSVYSVLTKYHISNCRGLTTTDFSFISACSTSGLAWSLYKCAALWRAVYGPSGTERPFGNSNEEKGNIQVIYRF